MVFETLAVRAEGPVVFVEIPAAGHAVVKQRVNAIAIAPAEDFRRDSDLFAQDVREPEAQGLLGAAIRGGFQTRDAEMDLPSMLGDLARGRGGQEPLSSTGASDAGNGHAVSNQPDLRRST